MVDAATSFKKSGFGDTDAANLALVASQFQNVADDAISAGEAADFIIAQMKAFNIEAENSAHIIDAVNEVSNKYAVSSSDLSTNLGKASAALAVGNNSFEEVLGLMTSGTEIIRNASRVARGLVSVQARLNQVVDESSSVGQALTAWYNEHKIAIYDQQGQLMSLFDILKQVADIWPTLTTNEKDYFLNQQAGANQTQNLAAILSNFDVAINATKTALDSAGSAAKENAAYMESLEAKTQALKATFQDLSNNVIDNELVGSILNLANNGLKLLNTEAGQTITQWTLLTGTLTGGITIFGTVGAKLFEIGKAAMMALKGAGPLAGGFTSIAGAAFPVAAAISAIAVAGYAFYNWWQDTHPSLVEAQDELKGLKGQLEENTQRLDEINKLPWVERTAEINAEKQSLIEENEELERNIELTKQRAASAAEDTVSGGAAVYTGEKRYSSTALYDDFAPIEYFNTYEDALQAIADKYHITAEEAKKFAHTIIEFEEKAVSGAEKYAAYSEILEGLTDDLSKNNSLSEESLVIRDKNIAGIEEQIQSLMYLKDNVRTLTDEEQSLVDSYNQYTNATEAAIDITNATNQAQDTAVQTIQLTDEKYKDLIKTVPELDKVLNKNGDAWNLNSSALVNAIENGDAWANKAIAQQGAVTEATIAEIERRISLYQAEMRSMMAIAGGRIGTSEATKEDIAEYNRLFQASTRLEGALARAKRALGTKVDFVPTETNTGKTSKKSPKDKALEEFNTAQKELEHRLKMGAIKEKDYYDELEKLVAQYKVNATAHMKEYGLTVEKINQNMYEYEEEIYKGRAELSEKFYKKEKEKQESVISYVSNYASKQIDALNDEIEKINDQLKKEQDELNAEYDKKLEALDKISAELEEQNAELDAQIERERLLQQLAQAQSVQKLVFKDGQFQYTGDVDAVSKAQSELSEFDKQREIARQQAEIAKRKEFLQQELKDKLEALEKKAELNRQEIENEIKKWETYKEGWENLNQNYTNRQNELIAQQELGIDLEKANWDTRLENLQSFVNRYNSLLGGLNSGVSGGASGESSGGGDGGGFHFGSGGSGHWTKEEMEEGFNLSDDDDDEGGWSSSGQSGSTSSLRDEAEQALAEANKTGQSVSLGGGVSIRPNKHALGTLSAPGGISLVGEKGPELRVLNSGDGILPNNLTANLWKWGSFTPTDFAKSISEQTVNMQIANVSLPNVTNAQSFVSELKNLAYQRAYKRG